MINKNGYKQTAEEVGTNYMKGKNNNKLKLIKDFIIKINNGVINNKNKAGNEFRKLKQKVTNDRLKQDLIKDLERYLFGEDTENIESEEKYEENIAERVKTRRQNKETDSDKYDSNGWSSGSGLKILTKKQMPSRLPTLLAEIQAGNNSNKLKNEIRQILYLLYRSKALTKTVYNNLIKAICTYNYFLKNL